MTTDIRETLHDIGASLAPPVIDRAGFDGRVRRARLRRRTGRVAVAAASAVAVGVTAWLIAPGGADGEPDMVSDLPSTGVSPTSRHVLAFEEQGLLFVSTPEDPSLDVDTGIGIEDVVAVIPDRVVYIDPESHLMQVELRTDGTVGVPTPLLTKAPVQWAGVDSDGTTLRWVTLDDRLGSIGLEEASDAVIVYADLLPHTTVLDVGSDGYVAAGGADSIQLYVGGEAYDIRTD
jgi:hypothetical protein